MKVILNPDENIVKQIKEGLEKKGGYCPCKLGTLPQNKCVCQEFKSQIADPNYYGACHCGLYVKIK